MRLARTVTALMIALLPAATAPAPGLSQSADHFILPLGAGGAWISWRAVNRAEASERLGTCHHRELHWRRHVIAMTAVAKVHEANTLFFRSRHATTNVTLYKQLPYDPPRISCRSRSHQRWRSFWWSIRRCRSIG